MPEQGKSTDIHKPCQSAYFYQLYFTVKGLNFILAVLKK
jgi:hypothetical protein